MIAKELISTSIQPVRTSDTGEEVLQKMQIYHVSHLPIVNKSRILGIISEEDILINDPKEPVGLYRLTHHQAFCKERDHIFDLMTKLGTLQLSVIPIVDEVKEIYLGVVTLEDLLKYFAVHFSFTDPGSIIVLECFNHNYLLSEIIRLAEADDISVLSSFITSIPGSNKIYITLKTNAQDLNAYKASLERFGYIIHASFSDTEYSDSLLDRFDSLMTYLNI